MKAIELSPQGEAPTRPRQFTEKPSFEEQKQNKPAQSHFWARGIIGISVVATFLPLAYLISVSLMGRDETVSGILWTLDPQFSNWSDVLFSSDIPRSIGNSLIAATFGALLSLAGGLPGAWAIVHYKTGGRALSALVTSPWLLPPVVAVIPLFILLRVLNLNDSLVGLTLIYALINLPIAVWLLEGFLHKIPSSIFDAAAVDGAGPWRTLVSIVTPLMLPALIAIGTIIAILNYNEFLLATFLTQSVESQTAPVALSLFYGDRTPHFGKIAAASVIVVIPVFAAATFLQRWMIDGLVNGVGK
ncbi:multiple sugar transport system permease protein [Neomicrococcus aestuarii]|uniref:Multiple sugar transport system permease protein n=1 Tax=Neomicrococcus aestuarii TaxID=556325 RepID=A0A7W8TY60_9MICC|nr:carbohydrate ABC transporter permease [Neomicrococcus aestuarii]MBB5513661.1 multiple sugar transport system permease protein [Neomicrococcus aestuarii]